MEDCIFLGSKITADGDCSHEIKRHLLLGSKAMTNVDSILKSRDITLLTEFHMVKVMAFPVVMYRCESQTISSIMTELWRSIRELMPSIVMWGKTLRRNLDFNLSMMRIKINWRTVEKAEHRRIDAFELWC